MPFVDIDTIRYYYRSTFRGKDQGPAVLFIHGSGGDGTVWAYQLGVISQTVPVIIPDLPGHGRSGGRACASAEDCAAWLERLCSALGTGRVFVVGHSLGGAVALAAARRYPDRLQGIVLAGCAAGFSISREYAGLIEQDFPAAVRASCDAAYAPGASQELYRKGRDMLLRTGQETMRIDINACAGFDGSSRLEDVDTPALIVCGDCDRITPPGESRELAGLLRNGSLALIEGAGHMVMIEAHRRFNELLTGFIEKYS